MAHIFVANPSRSHRHFLYRLPEVASVRSLTIAPLRQERLPGDFEGESLKWLIEQLEAAGGLPENDLRALTQPHSLVYKVAPKPMTSDKIDEAVERNEAAMQEQAAEQSEAAGLASFATLARPNPDALKASTLDVTQMADTPGEEAKKGGVDFEVRVDRKAPRQRTDGKRRG